MELRYSITDTVLTSIGDAIREKLDTTEQYKPSQMPEAIRSIKAGEDTPVYPAAQGTANLAIANPFSMSAAVESVSVPEGVVSLGNSCFAKYTNVKYIELPQSLTRIYGGALQNCASLEEITIPKNVISIGDYVFDGTPVKKLHFESIVPPTLYSSNSIRIADDAIIYVPAQSV